MLQNVQARRKIGKFVITLILVTVMILSASSCGNRIKTVSGVIAGEHYGVTDGMLVYYIVQVAGEITDEEAMEHNYDESIPLDQNMYDENTTWYDTIINRAKDRVVSLLIYCEAAFDDGVALEETDYQYIEEQMVYYRTQGVLQGNLELDEYLKRMYNYDITGDDLQKLFELECLADKYTEIKYNMFVDEITDEILNLYIDAMPEGEKNYDKTRRLGHILIDANQYDSNEDDMQAKALEIIEALKNTDLNESNFEAKAKEIDQSAPAFFENVAKDDMISVIDGWLYDSARSIGDLGTVASDYGVHILFYASEGEARYILDAKDKFIDDKFENWYADQKTTQIIVIDDKAIDKVQLVS